MPISKANASQYPGGVIGCRLVDVLGRDVLDAMERLDGTCGFDAALNADFWEQHVATRLGGDRTAAKAPHDVEVEIWGRLCLAEVKFSRAFFADYGRHSRYIFKWLLTGAQARERSADAVILIGVDLDRLVYAWVIPRNAFSMGKRSITVTAPHDRRTRQGGRIDSHSVPITELLPGFAHACHSGARKPITLLDLMEGKA